MNKKSIDYVKEAFQNYLELDSSHSLRSFANELGIPAGRLSQYFNAKRFLTANTGEKIADSLGWDEISKTHFLKLIDNEKRQRISETFENKEVKKKLLKEENYHMLSSHELSIMCSWYYYPILSLINCSDFKSDVRWIANRIGISWNEASQAIQLLLRLGMLKEENGSLVRSFSNLKSTSDISSEHLKSYHKEVLQKTIQAIDDVEVSRRDITSTTMAINVKRIPEAKKKIKEFKRELSLLLEEGKKDEVYNLNVQLVPMEGLQ